MDDMNDTTQTPPEDDAAAPPSDDDFQAQRLRTIADMRRSSDDRLVAGVAAGAARYLNIDPVVIRILFAVMTLVGGAGLIMYVAVWFLVPSDDAQKSVAADWFRLDDNEERVRVGGLVIAAVLAVLSVVGDSGWGWGDGFPWWIVAPLLLIYVFVVRPNRRRDRRIAEQTADPAESDRGPEFAAAKTADITAAKQRKVREPKSQALLGLTLSVAAIAVAVTRIVTETNGYDTRWTIYVAVALATVGLGLLISTFWGHGGALIPIGVLLALVLAVGSAIPSGRIGQQTVTPESGAELATSYTHGVGELKIDLTQVADPDDLLGRTIDIEAGIGHTVVTVPDGLDVAVRSELTLGEIKVFDKDVNGSKLKLDDPTTTAPGTAGERLTIDIDQKIGQIEVISE